MQFRPIFIISISEMHLMEYLQNNQTGITEGVQEIKWASKQEDINHAYSGLLVIFNGGKSLSLEQWDDLQDTALNY